MALNTDTKPDFFDQLRLITEKFLTQRKRIKRIKREKQARKGIIADWIEAFLWAAGVVLLINQYLFQAYQIPSGSMIDTLLIKDRVFVNKLIYGPELLPGLCKLPSPIKPQRNDVIIFESPSYISRGTAFDIAQRIIYMLTFSIIDIDKDEMGRPKPHFLIKRAVGMPGDRVFNKYGDMYFQFSGEDKTIAETDYNAQCGWTHRIRRLAHKDDYESMIKAVKADIWTRLGLEPPPYLTSMQNKLPEYADGITYYASWYGTLHSFFPNDDRYTKQYYRKTLGWYIPEGRILPLGDNRDNSTDGRFFGPVSSAKILGKGLFIYWPGTAVESGETGAQTLEPPPKTGIRRVGIIR